MLWVCLHLTDLALEIFTRTGSNADLLVVCEGAGRTQRVLSASVTAQSQGIRVGMRVSAALALNAALRGNLTAAQAAAKGLACALEFLAAPAGAVFVARADGQFDVVWRARRPVRPDPYLAWSRFETNWLEEGLAA